MNRGIGAIRVLLADDYPLLREGIRCVIERERNVGICGFAGNPPETLAALESLKPDVALIAFSLRSAATFALIKDARLRHEGIPLLVFSFKDDPVLATRVSRSGAQGFIARADPKECVVEAIHQLARGLTYVSPRAGRAIADQMFDSAARHPGPDGRTFTNGEEEILELVGGGFAPREIAEALRLSIKTVEAHRQNIKQKLRINTSARLAQYAFQWVQNRKSN
jgi:DNA-binding NarL/FixJ family response regulator